MEAERGKSVMSCSRVVDYADRVRKTQDRKSWFSVVGEPGLGKMEAERGKSVNSRTRKVNHEDEMYQAYADLINKNEERKSRLFEVGEPGLGKMEADRGKSVNSRTRKVNHEDEMYQAYTDLFNKNEERKSRLFEVKSRTVYDDEMYLAYVDQVNKTERYGVTLSPGRPIFGGIVNLPIAKGERFKDFDMLSQLAIDRYNSMVKAKEQLGLKFVKVLMVTSTISCYMTFYITFEAMDLDDGGMVKTYQTEVLMKVGDKAVVKAMRLKPDLDEHGYYVKSPWFWKEGYP